MVDTRASRRSVSQMKRRLLPRHSVYYILEGYRSIGDYYPHNVNKNHKMDFFVISTPGNSRGGFCFFVLHVNPACLILPEAV